MVAIIIGTHGNFSEELVRSSEMIFGKQSNVSYITFKQGEGLETLGSMSFSNVKELKDTKGNNL